MSIKVTWRHSANKEWATAYVGKQAVGSIHLEKILGRGYWTTKFYLPVREYAHEHANSKSETKKWVESVPGHQSACFAGERQEKRGLK